MSPKQISFLPPHAEEDWPLRDYQGQRDLQLNEKSFQLNDSGFLPSFYGPMRSSWTEKPRPLHQRSSSGISDRPVEEATQATQRHSMPLELHPPYPRSKSVPPRKHDFPQDDRPRSMMPRTTQNATNVVAVLEKSAAEEAWRKSRSRGSPSVSSIGSTSTFAAIDSGSGSDAATSPEGSANGDVPLLAVSGSPTPQSTPHESESSQRKPRVFGTPEMPRGKANLPHLPAGALNPRVPNSGHVKHLPRAEKLPLTGYDLLASKLSTHTHSQSRRSWLRRGSLGAASTMSTRSSGSGSNGYDSEWMPDPVQIKPLYRRFEAMNHRLLLHLQDELSELEEQLRRLDTADTQTRRLQDRILPASRRAESLSGGELQWHKSDILSKVGYKLSQYNHLLSSFTETQQLATPAAEDVDTYRNYLSTYQPIAKNETRFLDAADDLVILATSSRPVSPNSPAESATSGRSLPYLCNLHDEEAKYGQRSRDGRDGRNSKWTNNFLARPAGKSVSAPPSCGLCSPASTILAKEENSSKVNRPQVQVSQQTVDPAGLHIACALVVALLAPMLTFPLVSGFGRRMAIASLVAVVVVGALVKCNAVHFGQRHKDLMMFGGMYGGVMAIVAGIF